MVIGEGVLEKVVLGSGRFHNDLSATQISLGLVSDDSARNHGDVLKIRGQLCDGDIFERKFSLNGRTDTGLKVGVLGIGFRHRQRHRAVREEQFIAGNSAKVTLEARTARQFLRYHHRKQGWNVSFTTRRYPFGVKPCQCEAAGIPDTVQKIETSERKRIEAVLVNYTFQLLVNSLGAFE